jgi:hypothetical protein
MAQCQRFVTSIRQLIDHCANTPHGGVARLTTVNRSGKDFRRGVGRQAARQKGERASQRRCPHQVQRRSIFRRRAQHPQRIVRSIVQITGASFLSAHPRPPNNDINHAARRSASERDVPRKFAAQRLLILPA